MSDSAFPDRATQLRNRWEADPSSRIFLQLAEEYRHQGRVKEALDVLDRGLKEHPGYLSALVAKGRCHLELGEPEAARTVLERVVKQDATHMVANKLLVRAYLDTGEPDRARQRLDIYSLLNDSDPEIDELRRRLRAMEQPLQAEKPRSTPPSEIPTPEASSATPPPREAAPSPPAPPSPRPAADIFDLGLPAPRRRGDDLFELDVASLPAAAAVSVEEPIANLLAVPEAAVAPTSPVPVAAAAPEPQEAGEAEPQEATEVEEEPEPEGVLFPGLASRESRRRYLESLAAEGLFLLDLTAEAHPVEARMQEPYGEVILARAAGVEPEPPWIEPTLELPAEEPAAFAPAVPDAPVPEEEVAAFELDETTPWIADQPAPPVAEAPPAAVAEPIATATLAELYLRQGHLGEAERIFRDILRREPGNATAQEGLARAATPRGERRPLEAGDLLAGYEPVLAGEAEVKARKAWVLSGYLQRLRRGSQRDVS